MIENNKWSEPIEYWLSTYGNEETKKLYSRQFERFEEFVGKTGKQIIIELRAIKDIQKFNDAINYWSDRAIDFYEEILKDRASRTAWSYLTAVRSFFSTFGANYELPNIKRKMQRVSEKPHTERFKHDFTQEELKLMSERAGNFLHKALLLMGIQSGMASNELRFRRWEEIYPNWVGENWEMPSPIGPIKLTRKKEDSLTLWMFGADAKYGLKLLWEAEGRPIKGYIFHGRNLDEPMTKINPDKIIKMLARECGVKPRGSIRFHCLRAYHESQMKHAGVNPDYIDLMQGHKISDTKRAYTDQKVREEFLKAEERLSVRHVSANHESIEQIRQTVITQQKQISDYETRIKILTDEIATEMGRLMTIVSSQNPEEKLAEYVNELRGVSPSIVKPSSFKELLKRALETE